jgi:hypothetical protein
MDFCIQIQGHPKAESLVDIFAKSHDIIATHPK